VEFSYANGVKLACETGSTVYEQTWRKPAVTIIAQEASTIKGASNQVLPKASAIVSCRIVSDQEPAEVEKCLTDFYTQLLRICNQKCSG
jgi:hypothetical protein